MANDPLNLTRFFNPKSVALIGASKDPTKRSGAPLRILLKAGYEGNIYPINPKYDQLEGIKCYPSVEAVKDEIDLALILLPAKLVPKILKQCADKGVKFAIVISAGWAEIGTEGVARQREIEKIAQSTNLRICGPNCLGMVGFKNRIPATFYHFKDFSMGSVGMISQSGALAGLAKFKAESRNIHFSYWVTGGNEADLTTLDYAKFMVEDPDTKIIVIYMEGINDGNKFKFVASEALKKEVPIAVLKVGHSKIGKETAKTHTASLAGSDTAYKAFFNQYGIIQVKSIDEMLDLASFISNYGIPKSLNVGIISYSGGAATNLADSCHQANLTISQFDANVQKKLSSILEERVVKRNPLDLAGGIEPEQYDQIIYALADDDNIDVIVFMIGWWGHRARESRKSILKAVRNVDKPVIIIWPTPNEITEGGIQKLEKSGITVFPSIPRCIATLKHLNFYVNFLKKHRSSSEKRIKRRPKRKKNLLANVDPNSGILTEFESKQILQRYNIPITNERMVNSLEEAIKAAKSVGYPLALKVQSPDISHKTDVDIIRLNIQNKEQLKESYNNILNSAKLYKTDATIKGVLVQEMVANQGAEVILGMTKDRVFGPLIMFGLGGVFAEIIKDITFRVAPLTKRDIEGMIREIKGHQILEGARGKSKLDTDSLIDITLNISDLVSEYKDLITELDINPLIVFPEGKGAKVLDALITLDIDKTIQKHDH